jgi:lysophospholipase L1-like esterase
MIPDRSDQGTPRGRVASRASPPWLPSIVLACIVAGSTGVEAAVIGVVDDPCTSVPVQPTAAHSASADWYGNWMRDWLAVDFGQRCRYAAENRALGAASPVRVVYLGDSITEGWINAAPAMFAGDVLDRGIGGQTTEQMLVRFRVDVLDLHPAVVHIMAGTNDVAGNRGATTVATIEGNIRSLVEQARANGIAVVLASIPPASGFGWSPVERAGDTIVAINAWLRDYARRERIVYVDYHAALTDGHGGMQREFSEDGVHPGRAGYEVMRPLALAGVQAALESGVPAQAGQAGAGGTRQR